MLSSVDKLRYRLYVVEHHFQSDSYGIRDLPTDIDLDNAVRLHSAQRSASAPISTGSQFGRAHDVSRGSGPVEWYWEIQIQWVDRRGGSRDNNTPTLSWTFGCRADWGD